MKLEDQVCSLEYAKRLKELGVKQDSLFYWSIKDNNIIFSGYCFPEEINIKNYCSAFSVAELVEMLPDSLPMKTATEEVKNIIYGKSKGIHGIAYGEGHKMFPIFNDKTEANVRAKMLIYLIENKII